MAFIPVPNCVQVEMIYTQINQRVENVFHVSVETSINETTLQSIGAAFFDWYDTDLKARQHNSASFVLMVIKDLSSASALAIEVPVSPAGVGALGDNPAPNNCTVAIKWTTAQRGRSYRGRTYHVGLAIGQITASSLATGVPALLTTTYNNLITALNTASFPLVVASRFTNGTARTSGITTPILNAVVDPTLDSQRRRLPGRGE